MTDDPVNPATSGERIELRKADSAHSVSAPHNTIETNDEAEIARLAKLPPFDYDREREAAAERLKCRLSTLDAAVNAARGNGLSTAGKGRAIQLATRKPWDTEVDGAALLDALKAAIQRHVIIDGNAADAVALWILASYAFNAFFIFPRLLITSPEKRCGKSTLIDLIECLAEKPLVASHTTTSPIFRLIEMERPTILLDEAEDYLRDNEGMRPIINAGHKKNGKVVRSVGDDHEPREFSVYAPMVIAGIGGQHGTIEDRSIIIRLRRKRRDDHTEAFRVDRPGPLETLARRCARWARDHNGQLGTAEPHMPDTLYNRDADNCRPLFAVADAAGGDWPVRARRTAEEMAGSGDDQSVKVVLLSDIRDAFHTTTTDRMTSEDMTGHLASLEDRRWPEWYHGRPITKVQLAKLLKTFGISPRTIRTADGRTPKGYLLADFEDAFTRYLSDRSATPQQSSDSNGLKEKQSATWNFDVADRNSKKPDHFNDVADVADQNGGRWEIEI
jgi:Protein of unknown function (DUF3631)